jgi:branched-chain amino acid transport system permease protein
METRSSYGRQALMAGVCIGALLLVNHGVTTYMNPYVLILVCYCGVNIILGVSLNLVNGFTGQFSIGHAGFMAVGAYVSAAVSTFGVHPWLQSISSSLPPLMGLGLLNLSFLGIVLVGGLGASVFGYLIGIPSLRLRGDYLAVVTLGFGEIIRVMILNIKAVGGARGFINIPVWTNFFWIYLFAALVVLLSFRLLHSYHGRAFLSVREDEIAAESMGIDIADYKVKAFVLSSFFAGVAGALFGHFTAYLNPGSFTFLKSFEIIIIVVLGGMGSISGAVIAAVITTLLPEALRPLQTLTQVDFRMVIYPIILLSLMLLRPQGIMGHKEIGDLFWRSSRKSL